MFEFCTSILSSFNPRKSDPGDAFNQFWNIMQGMLDNLSQPVAFATVPLGETEQNVAERTASPPSKDPNFSSDTDSADEPIFSRFSRRIGFTREGKKPTRASKLSRAIPSMDDDSDGDLFDEGQCGYFSSQAICLMNYRITR